MNFTDLCFHINKLKIKQAILEKNEQDIIKFFKANDNLSVENEYQQLNKIREQELSKIKNEIIKNNSILKKIKNMLYENTLENLDILTLKNNMVLLENNICSLNKQISLDFENFTKEEYNLTIDLTNIEMKLNDMYKQNINWKITSNYSKINFGSQNLYEEVNEFTTFLSKTGGNEGGWVEEDHSIFVKFFNKFKNKNNELILTLCAMFPDMTERQIAEHIEWYKKYLGLKDKRKEAIERWKKTKCKKQVIPVEIDKIEDTTKKAKQNTAKDVDERKHVKEKVQQWKLQTQEKLKCSMENKAQISNKLKDIERHKQEKHMQKKTEIEKWKSRKLALEKTEKLEKEIIEIREKQQKISMANKLIRDFQFQDKYYINRRLATLKNQEPTNSVCNDKIENINVQRDPKRIYRPTKQWIARVMTNKDEKNNNISEYIAVKHIPKLAIPDWRKAAIPT